MRILFTGASSFTGFWFVKELTSQGHEVVAVFRQKQENYSGTRRKRVDALTDLCLPEFECEFGSDRFLHLVRGHSHWDLLCHHAADVADYKSPYFDFVAALDNNTKNLLPVLQELQNRSCHHILLTGTIFEQDEGMGSDLGAVYPYALSKGLTYQVFRYYAEKLKMALGKFIVANPFGPYEEMRFTSYLMRSWMQHQIPKVATPAYIRDNIPVDLLAKAYRSFAQELLKKTSSESFRPSCYVESQGDFAKRFAHEMQSRLPFECSLEFQEQTEFPEPYKRINTDVLKNEDYGWNEKKAWDCLANYYLTSDVII